MYQPYRLILTLYWFFSLKSNCVEARCNSENPPQVALTLGCVEGQVKTTALGRTYYSFQGIPYAVPPLGQLRFKAPQPPVKWSGVWKAVKEPPACLQPKRDNPFPIYFSEDCLYLNVFTPYLKHPSRKSMPVIVWIHGGKFFQSSGSTYKYGPDFLFMEDVVLVNINYRLGIFGFLNLNISEAQGNASLKDLIAALRWVQKEISRFGGDPSRVTIAGGSSGASNVAYLYISPAAKGLFHAAISHSGAALCYWSFLPSTASLGLQVAAHLGCPSHDPRAAVSCLRGIHGGVLAEQQMVVGGIEGLELPFVPSIETYLGEEVFLPDTPQRLISNSENIPYIIGFNDREGLMYVSDLQDAQNMKKNITAYLPVHMVKGTNQATLSKITSKIENFYFRHKNSIDDTYRFVDFMTDRQFSFCTLKTVEALKRRAPVYLYYFTFQGEFQPIHGYSSLNLTGVCHGDELGYFFYRNYTVKAHNNISLYSRDMAMVKKTVKLWTNFVTYGNPTPSFEDTIDIKWKPANEVVNIHLIMGDVLKVAQYSLLKDRETLWENIYQILFPQLSSIITNERHHLIYTVMCLLGVFSIILAVSYYIQYKRAINMYLSI